MNKNVQNLMFSSKSDEHATPPEFFQELKDEFGCELDVAATAENAKCDLFITKAEDGLARDWTSYGVTCAWMNPPYGQEIGKWVEKAYRESQRGLTVVCLLPARTDTRYWQDVCLTKGEVRFLRGRLKFSGAKNSAPFPSAVVIFHGVQALGQAAA